MLKKRHRYSFSQGVPKRVVHHPFFVLRYQEKEVEPSRFAFVVSKRIDNRAVGRNAIRRLFADIITSLLPQFEKKVDAVFYVRKPSAQASKDDVSQAVRKIFKKEGIIRE